MMHLGKTRRRSVIGGALLAIALSGCGWLGNLRPESDLQGTWTATEASGDLTGLSLTFDYRGNLSRLRYQIGSSTWITATNITSVTSLEGTTVIIAANFDNNPLAFTGGLGVPTPYDGYAAGDVMSGQLTMLVKVGSSTITVTDDEVILVRQ